MLQELIDSKYDPVDQEPLDYAEREWRDFSKRWHSIGREERGVHTPVGVDGVKVAVDLLEERLSSVRCYKLTLIVFHA